MAITDGPLRVRSVSSRAEGLIRVARLVGLLLSEAARLAYVGNEGSYERMIFYAMKVSSLDRRDRVFYLEEDISDRSSAGARIASIDDPDHALLSKPLHFPTPFVLGS